MKNIYSIVIFLFVILMTFTTAHAQADIEFTFNGSDWEGWTAGGNNASWGGQFQNNPNGQLKITPTASTNLIIYTPGHASSSGTAAINTNYKHIQIKLRNISEANELWVRAKYSTGGYLTIQKFAITPNDVNNDSDYTTYNFEITEAAWTTESTTSKWSISFRDTSDNTFSAQSEPKILIDNILLSQSSTLSTDYFSVKDFNIYPNPVQDVVNVSSNNTIHSIQVFDVLGKKVIEVEDSNTVDVSSLNKAVYLLEVNSDAGTSTKKFIKK